MGGKKDIFYLAGDFSRLAGAGEPGNIPGERSAGAGGSGKMPGAPAAGAGE